MLCHSRDGLGAEQFGVVVQPALQLATIFRQAQGEVELGEITPEQDPAVEAAETREWLDSLDYVLQTNGVGRAAQLLRQRVVQQARVEQAPGRPPGRSS